MLRARTERQRQRDRDRRSSSFCFYAPNLKCQPRWEVYQKIKRENNKHKQQDKKKQKGEILLVEKRERSSIYRRDFFKTVSTNQPKNEKAKQDEKYLDALSEARSILPLFLKDQQKANGRNPCVTTLYSLFRGRRTPPNNNNAHVLF